MSKRTGEQLKIIDPRGTWKLWIESLTIKERQQHEEMSLLDQFKIAIASNSLQEFNRIKSKYKKIA